MDPYLRRTLLAYIDLEYQHDSFKQGRRAETTTSSFIQTYSLLLRGNLFSRRFIIYDLGVAFTDTQTNYKTQNGKQANSYKDIDLTARTTILPLSAIPLTLYTERKNFYENSQRSTETIYGLNWMAKMRTLPMTNVNFQRTELSSISSDTVTTNANVNMSKRWGPSFNSLSYMYSASDESVHDLTSVLNSVNFSNQTAISRSTNFFMGASKSVQDSTGAGEVRLSGLNLGLDSLISRDLNQSHRYNYYSNSSSGSDQKGQTYFGRVNFTPSKMFSSALALDASDYVNNTPTNQNTEDNLTTKIGLGYHITTRLSLNVSASDDTSKIALKSTSAPTTYSKGTINRTDDSLTYLITKHFFVSEAVSYNDFQAKYDGQPALRYTLITEITSLGYRNDYHKWLRYHASAGAGFADEKRDGASNTGAIDNIDVGFTAKPNFSKYVGARAEVDYRRMDKLSENLLVNNRNQHYHIEVFNKYYKKYAVVSAIYDRYRTSSLWLNTLGAPLLVSSATAPTAPINVTTPTIRPTGTFDQTSQTFTGNFTSSYFRGSNISGSVMHTDTFNPITGSTSSDSAYLLATYARFLWKGRLQSTFSLYTVSTSTSDGSTSTNNDLLLNATYTRNIVRNLDWQGMLQYERKSDPNTWQTYTVRNTLNYNLRQWLFSATHSYALTRSLGVNSTDNSIYLRVSRMFIRFL